MGVKFKHWTPRSDRIPKNLDEISSIVQTNRFFEPVSRLSYGDYGLHNVLDKIHEAIDQNKRIALYADYDVDGTMSCVSWIWFFQALGFRNYVHYIPCRFQEGYGVNLDAIKHLIHQENADLIITMDTGITANVEASYCLENGVTFICTDHHKIQPEKMPDCLILNPKLHPSPAYQELCGCGVTFVLLRKLASHVQLSADHAIWTDILALTGMATICDVVPLNGVNHKLAKMGVAALMRSERPILKKLREAAQIADGDEKDVGFRLGPRINAVGRLEHADVVVSAFLQEDPTDLIAKMNLCNERRKTIQAHIVEDARTKAAQYKSSPILFLGGDWHSGVVGIAAAKIAEEFWRPTWLFQIQNGICKGSARTVKGFDVTEAMAAARHLFTKFGGHAAAGGFSFPAEHEAAIREILTEQAYDLQQRSPHIWQSQVEFDCVLPADLASLELVETLDQLKPFGHGFEEPKFMLEGVVAGVRYFNDKVSGNPKHTSITLKTQRNREERLMFFGEVLSDLTPGDSRRFVVSASRNTFRGQTNLQLIGYDYEARS